MTENSETYDLAIIGGGPAGYSAALYGGSHGLKIALFEMQKVGGTCLHRGCIPAKELLETSALYKSVTEAEKFGISVEGVMVDLTKSQARKASVIDQLYKGLSGLLSKRGVRIINKKARLLKDDKSVEAIGLNGDSEIITAENILLASGSVPKVIPPFVIDRKKILTSDELLEIGSIPTSALIVGGGAIGCEFASFLNDMGAKVTIIEALDSILPGCDSEISAYLTRVFKRKGIEVLTSLTVEDYAETDNAVKVRLNNNDEIEVENVVLCVGRAPLTTDLVEFGSSVEIDAKGYVKVDNYLRTSAENVYASGDIINTPQLAHVAFEESVLVIDQIVGNKAVPIDYNKVPWCIYSHPEVAFCGLSEEKAKSLGYEVVTKKDPFGGNSRAVIIGSSEGMVKVVAEKNDDPANSKILGVHMVGRWVTELLSAGYLAINWEASIKDAATFIQPHPTLSESFGETMIALTGKGLHVG
jgi:dihydrolipoamide dehydrogenase